MKTICENGNLKGNLKKLEELGYKYIVKAKDNFLSGWGQSGRGGHIQLIACKTSEEVKIIIDDLHNDKTFSYITWNYITNYTSIYNYVRGSKSFTIHNDWTRCFNKEENNVR